MDDYLTCVREFLVLDGQRLCTNLENWNYYFGLSLGFRFRV